MSTSNIALNQKESTDKHLAKTVFLAKAATDRQRLPEEITTCGQDTAMAVKSVSLDLNGEVGHQTPLPERSEHGEQL